MNELQSWQVRLYGLYPGLADYSKLDPDEDDLMDYFHGQGLDYDNARYLAQQAVMEAQAWQFYEEHPLAPRRWATHVGKGEKNF